MDRELEVAKESHGTWILATEISNKEIIILTSIVSYNKFVTH
jgi:hypothetical protein